MEAPHITIGTSPLLGAYGLVGCSLAEAIPAVQCMASGLLAAA